MGRFVQLVMGPAGTGKSTYCKTMQEHCRVTRRTMHVANLDPACDNFEYDPAFDIRDLISLDEVMTELEYGPNGGLIYCMEFLLQNNEWLKDELDNFGEDEYVILDCPGQVELYSHLDVMHSLAKLMTMWGYRVVSVYLLDALFVLEPSKFISGCLLSLSCMLQLELPHVNVITKCDIADKSKVEELLDSESALRINAMMSASMGMPSSSAVSRSAGKLRRLTEAMSSVIDDYMMVSFVLLDVSDEDSIEEVLAHTDHAVQYGEDTEPKEPDDGFFDEREENGSDYGA